MEPESSLLQSQVLASSPYPVHQSISPGPKFTVWLFRNMITFYGEKLLAPHPNSKLEDHPLSAVCDFIFNIFAATLHIEDRCSIRNLRTRHALVTGNHLTRFLYRVRHKYLTIWQHSCERNRWRGEFVLERSSSETQRASVAMERWSVKHRAFAVETYF